MVEGGWSPVNEDFDDDQMKDMTDEDEEIDDFNDAHDMGSFDEGLKDLAFEPLTNSLPSRSVGYPKVVQMEQRYLTAGNVTQILAPN